MYALCVPPDDVGRNRQGFFGPSEAHALLTPVNTAYTDELEAQRAVQSTDVATTYDVWSDHPRGSEAIAMCCLRDLNEVDAEAV
jgi:hypothetical protein